MSPPGRSGGLRARSLLRPHALLYLYRRRLRVHRVQESLAGLGVAVSVALVFAVTIANGSIAGSASEIVHAVIGPANLQLRARDTNGLNATLLARVQRLPGVAEVAPLLEVTGTILARNGRSATVDLAGTDLGLAQLNGLSRTLPLAAFTPGGIALSQTSARELGIGQASGEAGNVTLKLRGASHSVTVAAVLGYEAAAALSQARVAVMPLARLQRLAGLPGRVTRVLIETRPGRVASVRAELETIAHGRINVESADADISLLRQALRPADQASGFFAAISALLGLLFAFNAMLLTVPERRQAIADLRVIGTKRTAIVQLVSFQALCLGVAASLVGLLVGYALSLGVFHQSSGYLAEAFTLGTGTVVGLEPVLLALAGGTVATLLASALPLFDLRRGRALDAVYFESGAPGNALARRIRLRLGIAATGLLTLASVLFLARASLGFVACGVLALAAVFTVPLTFAATLRIGDAIVARYQQLTVLQVSLVSLRAATLRSLALAATGAVAIFGSIALGGSRDDLLRGIDGFAHSYAADADLLVTNPGDNQATLTFMAKDYSARIARIPGVAGVSTFQGGFLEFGNRRTWVIARPPGADRHVLTSQILEGSASTAVKRLGEGGWVAVSKQIAEAHHVKLGGVIVLPTPTGEIPFRLAATTTNLAWSPGVIFLGAADYQRFWASISPTALAVSLSPHANAREVKLAISRVLGRNGGLEVTTAHAREQRIDKLTSEGLSRLGEISTLLIAAAILAMTSALASSIWQRRASLASLRLAGVRAPRLRRILLTEAVLMLSAGCITGAVAGIYGQIIIDGYLKHVTGFPVASLAANLRPLELLALVGTIVLAIAAVPGWSVSRVSPALALDE